MKEYDVFRVAKGSLTISSTDQIYFEVSHGDKFESFCRIVDMEEDFYGIVFCRTKVEVDTVSRWRKKYEKALSTSNFTDCDWTVFVFLSP